MKLVKVEKNRVYTPVIRYRRNDQTVTVIGTLHLGSRDYYQSLQQEINRHPEGFFEGGIKPSTPGVQIPPEKEVYIGIRQVLADNHRALARYLGLETQRSMLTYGDLWQNPDITLDEFLTAAPHKVLRRLLKLKDSIEILEDVHRNHPEELARYIKGIHLFQYKFPFAMNILFSRFGVMDRGVILDLRNSRLFGAVGQNLDDEGIMDLGIAYGSAHLDGIDRYLMRHEFKREGDFWVLGWEMTENQSFWKSSSIVVNSIRESARKKKI